MRHLITKFLLLFLIAGMGQTQAFGCRLFSTDPTVKGGSGYETNFFPPRPIPRDIGIVEDIAIFGRNVLRMFAGKPPINTGREHANGDNARPARQQMDFKVGYEPGPSTETGTFKSKLVGDGVFTEKSNTLDGYSIWISALDGSYQARTAFRVRNDSQEGYEVPTLVIEGLTISGTENKNQLVDALLKRVISVSGDRVKEIRLKIRSNERWDYDSQAAHQFAVDLNGRVEREGESALRDLQEIQTLRDLGWEFNFDKSGLWQYREGDTEHYFLVATKSENVEEDGR